MPEIITAAVAGYLLKPVADSLLVRLFDRTLGEEAIAPIANLKSAAVRDAKNSLRISPPEPNENQDINHAITRAFLLAGEIWLNDVSKHAKALGNTEDNKFCERTRLFLNEAQANGIAIPKNPLPLGGGRC